MQQISDNKIYQVATLQALALGYSKKVVTVGELLENGDTGLGTFEDINGEMIAIDGKCYRADSKGNVTEMDPETGVPFAAVTFLSPERQTAFENVDSVERLKQLLDLEIEKTFGLNSVHVVRINGDFDVVYARSETPFHSQHIELKQILGNTQTEFHFDNISGSLVCVYYPDYMKGINAAGWHFHFVSDDRTKGGHVFEIVMNHGEVFIDKISRIEIKLPTDAAFDTYTLTEASEKEIKQVEQGE